MTTRRPVMQIVAEHPVSNQIPDPMRTPGGRLTHH
jgi:hypothetical protein